MAFTTQQSRQQHERDQGAPGSDGQPAVIEPAGSQETTGAVAELVRHLLGADPRVTVMLWDGTVVSGRDPVGTLQVRSPDVLRRVIWAPGELGLARAFVSGELDVEGDVIEVLAALRDSARGIGPGALPTALRAARAVGALGRPLAPPAEEARVRGRRHSKRRDEQAVRHHYDVGNEFYELVLGDTMTYSCAYFDQPDRSLSEAQTAKHELICRKLGLHELQGARLLDVGCGWGSMAIHAARRHGASVVGITISPEQAKRARERAAAAGVDDQVEIRLQDYRDLSGEEFDAISSIGMFEHVGRRRTAEYFETLRTLLRPRGRLLNHAISSTDGSRLSGRSFTGRYVFPDGELLDVGDVVLAMQDAGFEVRDVEGLREHYALTLRAWVANLEAGWDRAVELVGEPRARVWRLYMAGSALGFEDGGLGLHQVLGVLRSDDGASGMPSTRAGWVADTTITLPS
ncbi:MAG: class I SAM-dependent methyltransferase [Actinomycetota bacterium]